MKYKVILFNNNGDITTTTSGKLNLYGNKMLVSEDAPIDLVFDKIVDGKLVVCPEEDKNILDKIYLENNVLHNVPLGAKVWINGEFYSGLQSPIQLETEFSNTKLEIRVTMLPHREWKNYE